MPEGDTIFRAAATLQRALAGKEVVRFESVFSRLTRVDHDAPLCGRTIERVSSVGKHLLIHFSGDLVLRTHMRMNGSWHIYRSGERWRRPAHSMRIVLATSDFEAVGFDVPVAEFIRGGDLARDAALSRLGPDLLAPDIDADLVMQRLELHSQDEIGVAMLDQSIAAGVGNVFKSEVMFVCNVHPFHTVESIPLKVRQRLFEVARIQLQQNVGPHGRPTGNEYEGSRRTTGRLDPSARLWVYGRRGKGCRRCGTAIEMQRQGLDSRSTYWCPRCQPK